MDYIKKIICLEDARTRTQGLMPYYEFRGDGRRVEADGPDGNYGHFVANPCFLANNDKTYEGMLKAYYSVLNIVRNSVKLRKVETKKGEIIYTQDLDSFEWDGICFDEEPEPNFLYEYAAYDSNRFYSTEIDSIRDKTRYIYREYGGNTVLSKHTHIVLIDDIKAFDTLISYLDGTPYSGVKSGVVIDDGDEQYKWSRFCQVVDACIGKINIPAYIFNNHLKVPKSMPCADIEPYIEWLKNNVSGECCNAKLWEERGGKEMLDFLTENAGTYKRRRKILNDLDYAIPYISVPISITQSFTDVGVLTNIDGVDYISGLTGPVCDESEPSRPHGYLSANTEYEECGLTEYDIALLVHSGVGLCIDQIVMGSKIYEHPTTEEYEANPSGYTDESGFTKYAIEVESLLKTLRNRKKYTDDKNNVLPGMFNKFNGKPEGQMYACVKHSAEKFYILQVSAHTIEDEVVIDYCVKYVEATMTRDDIYGINNFMDVMPANPFAGHLTKEEANSILEEQSTHYTDVEKDVKTNPYVYKISVSDPIWEIFPYDLPEMPEMCINADGLFSQDVAEGGTRYPDSDDFRTAAGKLYRTITTPSAGIRIAETEEEETGIQAPKDYHYFFMVKYDNSSGSPMTIPYKKGNTANVYMAESGSSEDSNDWLYRGDFILDDPKVVGPSIEFRYVIGGYYSGDSRGNFISAVTDTGDIYYEKHSYDPAHVDYVAMDGVDNVPVWSNYIDFDADAKEFYSPRYGLYRTGNTANIISTTTGDIWKEEHAYDAYLAKEDYLTNFSLPPKVDVNVTIDRGGVSVFEKHYKLAECNTMQDLTQYGNNFFNL